MRLDITPTVRTLLLLNVLIYVLQTQIPFLTDTFALYPFQSQYFKIFQPVTYMFLHGGVRHIFSNMLGLFFFGPMLERVWGPKRFLIFYLITGIGAGLLHNGIAYYELSQLQNDAYAYRENPTPEAFNRFLNNHAKGLYNEAVDFLDRFDEDPTNGQYIQESKEFVSDYYLGRLPYPTGLRILTVGASGAIFGILLAFGLLFPNTEIFLYFLFPIKAKYLVILYGLYELFGGLQQAPGDNVAHFAHLGGMLFGFILIKYWGIHRDKFY